jgi:probable rRNA maturation factor
MSFEGSNIVSSESFEPTKEQLRAVKAAAGAALGFENASERFASIVLTDDETIHRYNRDYRGVDRPTDVLSFPSDEGDPLEAPPDGFLGDIMISVQRAAQQGSELGHSTEREIAFLTVHGMLHLLGYDHMQPDDEELMLSRQRAIMSLPELSEIK